MGRNCVCGPPEIRPATGSPVARSWFSCNRSAPKATYLSDLAAAEYRHVPYLDLPWPYAADRNVTGGRLRCGGRLFVKGIGMHSSARLTYSLPKPFARFEAAGGIDDSAGGAGSVRVSGICRRAKKIRRPNRPRRQRALAHQRRHSRREAA